MKFTDLRKEILIGIAKQGIGWVLNKIVVSYEEYLNAPSEYEVGSIIIQYRMFKGVTVYRVEKLDGEHKLVRKASASYAKMKKILNVMKILSKDADNDIPF